MRQEPVPSATRRRDGRAAAHVVYAIYAVSIFTAVPMFIGAIVAYLTRGDARGTIYRSHLDWGIRTFWWTLLWTVVGVVLILVLVGYAILFVVWLWFIYRTVRGWLRLLDDRPAPGVD